MVEQTFPIVVEVDPSRAKRGAAEVEKSLSGVEDKANRLRSALNKALAFAGISFGLRELVRINDEFARMENRLRTQLGAPAAEAAFRDLFEVAQRTQQGLRQTTDTFLRLQAATRSLGATVRQNLAATEALADLIQISGLEAEQAAGALAQLSIAMTRGELSGRGLITIFRDLPELARLLARDLGVAEDRLFDLASAGRIAGSRVFQTLIKNQEELARRARESSETVGDAFAVLRNAFALFVSDAEGGIGVLENLRVSILEVARGVEVLGASLRFIKPGEQAGLTGVFAQALLGFRQLTGELSPEEAEAANRELDRVIADRLKTNLLDLGDAVDRINRRYDQMTGAADRATAATRGLAAGVGLAAQELGGRIEDRIRALDEEHRLLRAGLSLREEDVDLQREMNELRANHMDLALADRGADLVARVDRNASLLRQVDLLRQVRGAQVAYDQALQDAAKLERLTAEEGVRLNQVLEDMRLAALDVETTAAAGFERGLIRMQLSVRDWATVTEELFTSAFRSVEDALVQFARTGQISFRDLANSILDDVARIITRLLLLRAVQGAAGFLNLGTGIQTVALAQHGGTFLAGQDVVVGERGPELVRFGQTGTVIPAPQTAQMLKQEPMVVPAPKVDVSIVNVSDPDEVPSAIGSGRADRAVLNVLGRNRQQVRKTLGI